MSSLFIFSSYNFAEPADIGNFNYGYTERYMNSGNGIPRPILIYAAGLLQTGKDIVNFEYSKAIKELDTMLNPRPPYGDELDDFLYSLLGMDYADSQK